MKERNDMYYGITNRDGSVYEAALKREAKAALLEGKAVVKNTRKVFVSGLSGIRVYANAEIKETKDL